MGNSWTKWQITVHGLFMDNSFTFIGIWWTIHLFYQWIIHEFTMNNSWFAHCSESRVSTIPGKVHAKIEKTLPTSFWENALKCKNGTILTFWPLKNNLYSDSTDSFLWYVVKCHPKKLHAKKEKKLLKRFWDWPFPPPPLKVDAADADKGQVSIWKAPLPDGTAELNTVKPVFRGQFNVKHNVNDASLWSNCGRVWLN